MTEQFTDPAAPGAGIDFNQLRGRLLLLRVLALEPHVPTVHTLPGEKSPAIRADVTILDGPEAGTRYDDTLIFPKMLQAQLRRSIGATVLGRLTQGQPTPGKNAPWLLDKATEADTRTAQAYLAGTPTSSGNWQDTSAKPPF